LKAANFFLNPNAVIIIPERSLSPKATKFLKSLRVRSSHWPNPLIYSSTEIIQKALAQEIRSATKKPLLYFALKIHQSLAFPQFSLIEIYQRLEKLKDFFKMETRRSFWEKFIVEEAEELIQRKVDLQNILLYLYVLNLSDEEDVYVSDWQLELKFSKDSFKNHLESLEESQFYIWNSCEYFPKETALFEKLQAQNIFSKEAPEKFTTSSQVEMAFINFDISKELNTLSLKGFDPQLKSFNDAALFKVESFSKKQKIVAYLKYCESKSPESHLYQFEKNSDEFHQELSEDYLKGAHPFLKKHFDFQSEEIEVLIQENLDLSQAETLIFLFKQAFLVEKNPPELLQEFNQAFGSCALSIRDISLACFRKVKSFQSPEQVLELKEKKQLNIENDLDKISELLEKNSIPTPHFNREFEEHHFKFLSLVDNSLEKKQLPYSENAQFFKNIFKEHKRGLESPSSLQKLYQCPFLYASEKLARLQDKEHKDSVLLSPMRRGNAVHASIEKLYQPIEKDWSLETIQKVHEVSTLKSFQEVASEHYRKILKSYAHSEAEKIFIHFKNIEEDYLKEIQPLKTQFERQINFQIENLQGTGRIDRFDTLKNQKLFIWDYKTGKVDKRYQTHLKNGLFQNFIYALALMQNGHEIAGLTYMNPLDAEKSYFLILEEEKELIAFFKKKDFSLEIIAQKDFFSALDDMKNKIIKLDEDYLRNAYFPSHPLKESLCNNCRKKEICGRPNYVEEAKA